MKKVTLVLDDGTKFDGYSFGYEKPVAGEVVFNTAMMGYPESLTDPSYAGQMLVMTFPLVGNYGVPKFSIEPDGLPTFMESDRIYATAIIVSDYSQQFSHWNASESLADWLKREQVPGITGIDTRQLTKLLRERGVMMGQLVFSDSSEVVENPESYDSINWVERVSCKEVIRYNEGAGKKVSAFLPLYLFTVTDRLHGLKVGIVDGTWRRGHWCRRTIIRRAGSLRHDAYRSRIPSHGYRPAGLTLG
jgi:carbamoyl-phosphate synthase small subunit